MIENKCTQWYESERCTVKNLIEYIEKTGQMRDAQIEAIKVYLPAVFTMQLPVSAKKPARYRIQLEKLALLTLRPINRM